MIKAVIFDWGEVLIENPAGAMLQYFSAHLGVSAEDLNRIYAEFVNDFQKGFITEKRLWGLIAARLGIKEPTGHGSLWREAFSKAYRPRTEMFRLLSDLRRAGFRVGLLSNTEAPAVEYFHAQGYQLFDHTVFSCLEGVVKPEPRIYELALERMGVKPDEAVFIDDRPDFIEGAKKIGLATILFRSPEQVREDLRSCIKSAHTHGTPACDP